MKRVITIDGPSGVGKTTIGLEIATKLNYSFFSSGKLYRYVAKYLDDEKNIKFNEIEIIIDNDTNCFINNQSYKDEQLYNKKINNYSSEIAKDTAVRELIKTTLLNYYEDIDNGLVIEGRDMGSVVFPNADIKFYLDADEETRGKRRENQSGSQETIEDVIQRDHKDMHREASPLVIPENAIIIDNSKKSKAETVDEIIKKLKLL
tara:strand:- start:1739 stop:2353 length:615 start_codon:yes stop_codon:yes gene_type:complete